MICCICNTVFDEHEKINMGGHEFVTHGGHNPAPVKDEGRCCSECNYKVVIPARLKESIKKIKK